MAGQRKKLRRSSFNRLKKDLKIFEHNNKIHHHHHDKAINGFENLIDESYENLLALESNEIPEFIEEEEEEDDDDSSDGNTNNIVSGHSLENNDDFIAFDSDTSESSSSSSESPSDSPSESDLDHDTTPSRQLNTEFPWLLTHNHTKELNISDWLTTEIKDFIAYISPNKEEIEQRNHLIKTLRYLVKQIWSDSHLHVFGSFATDLYLPGSDIDVVINSDSGDKEHRQYLYDLARHLKSAGVATQIEVISKTRVPIVKFVEPDSGLHIDVSFERTNGLDTAKLIRDWLSTTPGLRELVLIIKQFLASRRLNDVHTGGLGGFSIICMVYSFLQSHPKIKMNEINPLDNLGVLLIEFFELYGKNFAYDEVAIAFNEDEWPIYVPKSHWKALLPVKRQFSIAIQDPKDPSNNLSRGSFNLGVIKKSFAGAFDLLTNKCFELNQCTFKDRVGKSILGNVIKYKGSKRDFKDERDLVINSAIVENERFHSVKRSFITMQGNDDSGSESESGNDSDRDENNEDKGEMFLNPSDDDILTGGQDDMEMYKLDKSTVKSLLMVDSKKKEKEKNKIQKKKRKVNPEKLIKRHSPTAKRVQSIDSLMGLSDGNQEGENNLDSDDNGHDTNATSVEPSPAPMITLKPKEVSKLKKSTLDAQTRRNYWLSKGNTLGSG